MKHVEHWPDIGYTVVATAESKGSEGPYFIEWKALTLYEGTDKEGRPWRGWQRNGAQSSPDPTDDIEAAEVFVYGATKFDGCSNFTFADHDRECEIHTCARRDMVKIGTLLARVHDLCGEMLGRACFEPEPMPPSAPEIVNASADWHSIK